MPKLFPALLALPLDVAVPPALELGTLVRLKIVTGIKQKETETRHEAVAANSVVTSRGQMKMIRMADYHLWS